MGIVQIVPPREGGLFVRGFRVLWTSSLVRVAVDRIERIKNGRELLEQFSLMGGHRDDLESRNGFLDGLASE